ncbi:MAG: hypothetical protein F6K56_23410 [Moorea sp. SIO3G5]|nr:hypothetical protein [Moorena sp. SIO3G5]
MESDRFLVKIKHEASPALSAPLTYGGLHNYQVHRIVFPLASSLLPAPCSLLPKNPELCT